jgi:hypothetical protein
MPSETHSDLSACPRTTSTNNRSKASVRTTHRSAAAIASAWFRRNVFQLCDGGLPPRHIVFLSRHCRLGDFGSEHQKLIVNPGRAHSGFSWLLAAIGQAAAISVPRPCASARTHSIRGKFINDFYARACAQGRVYSGLLTGPVATLGVGGSPVGANDEACAEAGVAKIHDRVEAAAAPTSRSADVKK